MRTLLLIRTLAFVLMFLLYKNFSCFSQSTADTVRLDLLRASTTQSLRKIFEKSSSTVPSAYLLTPDWAAISKLSKFSQPGYISFQLPVSGTSALSIVIKEVPVLAKGFRVTTSSNRPIDLPAIRFYTGKLVGDDSSTVSLTISEDGIEGLVYGQSYSYTFGKIRGTDAKKLHMVYQTHEMPEKAQIECTSVEAVVTNAVKSSVQGNSTARTTAEGCRKVGIYMEADYTLYQNWGSDVAHITNQIVAIFNNVATLYANEGVTIELSELKIWDTQDPYFSATNRGELLAQFKDYWNSRGNTFNGDMAHLLSSRINGGGVAYNGVPRRNTSYSIDDFASVFSSPVSRQFAFGVSTGIADGPVPPLPEYSYRTYLIAHELGHNFGLPHSHSCFWHGGPIDNCATTENGPCPAGPSPANGGTIMSYCPNLANGFGPQPSAKLKYEFITGQNLMHPGSNPPGISLSQSTVMKGQSVEIPVSNCSGSVSWDDGVVTGNIRRIIARAPTRYTAICGADGCLSASAEVFLNTVCVQPTACTVSYSAILNHIHGIHLFSLGTISTNDINATPINVGSSYQDLTCTQHTVLKAGDSYPFNLTSIYDFELNARIYIDYNGDGVFSDTNELVYSGGNASQHNGNISVPNSALRNTPLRMRVLMNALPISSACSLPSNGQYRSGKANDYAVTIAAPTCPPNQRETVQSGDWNDPLVWSCGTLPAFSDIVKINTGHFISLPPAYTGNVLGFELLGTIQYGVNATIRLNQP